MRCGWMLQATRSSSQAGSLISQSAGIIIFNKIGEHREIGETKVIRTSMRSHKQDRDIEKKLCSLQPCGHVTKFPKKSPPSHYIFAINVLRYATATFCILLGAIRECFICDYVVMFICDVMVLQYELFFGKPFYVLLFSSIFSAAATAAAGHWWLDFVVFANADFSGNCERYKTTKVLIKLTYRKNAVEGLSQERARLTELEKRMGQLETAVDRAVGALLPKVDALLAAQGHLPAGADSGRGPTGSTSGIAKYKGATALALAARGGHAAVAALLLERGARPDATDDGASRRLPPRRPRPTAECCGLLHQRPACTPTRAARRATRCWCSGAQRQVARGDHAARGRRLRHQC
ncbi:Protein of unknown function, partial [Gryllus bimaculatus]